MGNLRFLAGTAFLGFVLVISCASVNAASHTGGPTEDWSMFRYDLNRTGFSPYDAPYIASLSWSKKVPSAGEFWSSPSIIGDRIYIGNSNGKMYCLNANNGNIIWTFSTGLFAIYSSPAIAYGMVYFGGSDMRIYALPCDDPNSDGTISPDEVVWNYTVGTSTGGVNNVVCGSPAVKDGRLYLGAVDQYFYCFNATNGGAPLWKTYTPYRGQHAFSSSPAIHDGMIYTATGNQPGVTSSGRLYCFNESDGRIVWQFDLGDTTYSTPAVYGSYVYIANSGDWIVNAGNRTYEIYCLDADGYLDGVDDGVPDNHYANSDLIWSYNTSKYVYSSPALHDGRLYFGCSSGNFTCIDAATGQKIWVCETLAGTGGEPGGIMGSPAIAEGKVFIGTADGYLLALPETDPNGDGKITPGEYAWSYKIGGKVVCSPAIADGMVFIANSQGTMFCFGNPPVGDMGFLPVPIAAAFVAVCSAVTRFRKK